MKTKKRLTPRPQLGLFTPKVLQFGDIDWPNVFTSDEFKMIGLCNDPDRRGCYGKPVIVDPVAAPMQGLPYVMELKSQTERELNSLLWQLELLVQRETSFTARLSYAWAVNDPERGREAITPEAHFETWVRRCDDAGLFARVSIRSIPQRDPGEPDEDEFGRPIHDELTRFFNLDYVSKVIYGLEQHARWLRQSIYYDRAVARDAAEQRANHERTLDRSQKHWANIDEIRESARLRRLAMRRAAPELVPSTEPESEFANQLDMFS